MSSRRARRRQGQASQGSRWTRRTFAILGAAALVVMISGYVGVRRYLHSESFRAFLSAKASHALKADGRFALFRWDGLQIETPSFEATSDGLLQQFQAKNLHTEIGLGGLRRGVWEVKESNVGSIDMTIDARQSTRTEVREEQATTPKPPAPTSGKPWLPSEVELQGLTLQEINVRAILDSGLVSATGMQARVDPGSGKDAYRLAISGGQLTLPWSWAPPVKLEHVKARYQDRALFLTDATATLWESGRLQADGEYDANTREFGFQGDLRDLPCANLLSTDWAKRVNGRLNSTFRLEGDASRPVASGRAELQDGVLTALPVLDALAAYADTTRFRVLALNEAHADWRWEKDATTLTNLVLSSEGLVRLEGSFSIRGRILDGNFRLGLAPGTLAAIPGAETDVFFAGERGLMWTPLRITGTLDDPKEDLTDRLVAAAGLRMFDILPQTGERVLKFSKTALRDLQPKLMEQGVKTLERGVDAVEKGREVIEQGRGLLEGATGALDTIFGKEPPPPPPPPRQPEPPAGKP